MILEVEKDVHTPRAKGLANHGPSPSSPRTRTRSRSCNCTLYDVARQIQEKVAAFLGEEHEVPVLRAVQRQIREAMGVIDAALERYSPSQVSLSYNGGKDCLVLLVLILACLPARFSAATCPPNLQAVYIVSEHPFAEVDAFVAESAAAYHLALEPIALRMREGLRAYLDARPDTRAVFVGTRRTDPHGARLSHFDPTDTDKGWPDFVRVHPVIDWHYVEIWAFIRHLDIAYCSLYDRGYTSLGGTTDTHPNPTLKKEGPAGGFRPAYELMDDYEERLGRE